MSRIPAALPAAAVLLWASVAICANTNMPSMTIDEAIATAVARDPELHGMRHELAARTEQRDAITYPNPLLELDGRTGAITGSPDDSGLSVGLTQEFVLAGKLDKRRTIANQELESLRHTLSERERQLALEIKISAAGISDAERRLALAEKALELAERFADIAHLRFEAGDIAELERNQAASSAARARLRKLEAENELLPLRLRLKTLLGSDHQHVSIHAIEVSSGNLPSAPQLKALAREKRPELRRSNAEIARSEAEAELARAERMPNLTAGFVIANERSVTELGGAAERKSDYLVGLKLSMPIPLFDHNRAAIAEARGRQGVAAARRQSLLRQVELEIDEALARLEQAASVLELHEKALLPRQEENLRLVQEAYALGELGALAVMEEQRKFIEGQESHISALSNRILTSIKLEAAIGGPIATTEGGTK